MLISNQRACIDVKYAHNVIIVAYMSLSKYQRNATSFTTQQNGMFMMS